MTSRPQIKIVIDDDDEDELSREEDDTLPNAERSEESRESAEELATTVSPIPPITEADDRAKALGPIVELTTGRIEGRKGILIIIKILGSLWIDVTSFKSAVNG